MPVVASGPEPVHGASVAPASWRAVLLGTLLAPLVSYWVAYTQIRANSTDLVMMSLFTAALFPLLVLLALNTLLRRVAPRVALRRGELLTIYVMLTCTVGLAEWVPGEDATGLMRRADQALYRGKTDGRDRTQLAPRLVGVPAARYGT